MEKKYYAGLDWFRIIAAQLVVSVHELPFASYNESLNLFWKNVPVRTAVPFFLMTSGFFLLRNGCTETEKRNKLLKKLALIYVLTTVLYIPVNYIKGYYSEPDLFVRLLRDVVFNGTYFHLWYLPATMLGVWITWTLVKKLGMKKAFAISVVLYIFGLLGDGYYGITLQIPALKKLYDFFFLFFDYTRNGIFMAPIFLILGGMIAERKVELSLRMSVLSFLASLFLMTAEWQLLYHYELQRHCSMYVLLPVCMYFLFSALTHFTGKNHALMREISLWIYLIHPLFVGVIDTVAAWQMFAGSPLGNSLVRYLLAAVSSTLCSIVAAEIVSAIKRKKTS